MRALLLIPINLLILNIRLWIMQYIFGKSRPSHIVMISLLLGVICASALLVYPHLLELLTLSDLHYGRLQRYPQLNLLVALTIYLLIILFINTLIAQQYTSIGTIMKQLRAFVLIAILSYLFLGSLEVDRIIVYYLIVAFAEEALKYLSALAFSRQSLLISSDLILYAMLVSLGFAFFENIVYLIGNTRGISSRIEQLTGGGILLTTRWLIWFLVHMIFTGSIALLIVRSSSKLPLAARLLGAVVVWLFLHVLYNTLLHYSVSAVILIYLLGGYILLSWLFFQSDRLYLESSLDYWITKK